MRKAVFGLLFGLLLLCLVEILLRLVDVGHSHRLFLSGGHSQQELLYLNSRFANQYYPRLLPSIPTPGKSVLFERHKQPGTFRIFVLGESTSQGFPYGATEAFPFQLEQMLTRAGIRCEVINLSMSAITSYVGLDMAREVAELSPDLVLVYFGHNEFLGIGGSASPTSPLFQLNQLASHLRIYQTIKQLLSLAHSGPPASLLEIMSNVPGTPLGGERYEATLMAYRRNLEAIVKAFSSAQAEVLILGVARNLRDFPPFRSGNPSGQSDRDDLTDRLDRLFASSQPLPAAMAVEDALESYALGKTLLQRGLDQRAREYFVRACDLDQLRFRASTGIRHVAREVCQDGGCGYLDLQPIVDGLSPGGVAGNDIFVDQVHPSRAAHHELARELAGLILQRHFATTMDSSFAEVVMRSTLVDRIKAANTLETLYRTAMFQKLGYDNDLARRSGFRSPDATGEHGDELLPGIRRQDVEYIQSVYANFPETYQLHISYGAWLIKQRRHEDAFAEFRQAATLNRFSVSARNNLALMYANLGRYDEAMEALRELTILGIDDPRLWESLYRLHVVAGRDEEARRLRDRLPENGEMLEEDIRGLILYEF
ncbi:MAG: hypothetical protein HN712_12960 [Gemmatimonadetes bacterium]|nr:hypothetical protein [Gemmatimonadota bacterium]